MPHGLPVRATWNLAPVLAVGCGAVQCGYPGGCFVFDGISGSESLMVAHSLRCRGVHAHMQVGFND